jgi:tRNA threonylcarbamoyladenosine biosynthesis protein TsaB
MNLLALETSTELCSVALLHDGVICKREEYAPRRHAELLLTQCEDVLAEAGLSRRDLDAVAVGRGPGAFTGVRLAISAAQGIALALDLPVLPVSSLAALAMDAPADGNPILAVIDARMGEIYAGVFRRAPDGTVALQGVESVGTAERLIIPRASAWNVIGTAWAAYADILRRRLDTEPLWAEAQRFPRAESVARLAASELGSSAGVAPEFAIPVYLRDKVAFTTSEREGRIQAG